MNDKIFALRVKPTVDTTIAIQAYDANHCDPQTGHHRIDVRVRLWTTLPHGKRSMRTIFKRGETWCAVNRWTAIDSKAAKELVLSLVAMKPGDTDSDYFANYTSAQLAFASTYGDELSMTAEERYR